MKKTVCVGSPINTGRYRRKTLYRLIWRGSWASVARVDHTGRREWIEGTGRHVLHEIFKRDGGAGVAVFLDSLFRDARNEWGKRYERTVEMLED